MSTEATKPEPSSEAETGNDRDAAQDVPDCGTESQQGPLSRNEPSADLDPHIQPEPGDQAAPPSGDSDVDDAELTNTLIKPDND